MPDEQLLPCADKMIFDSQKQAQAVATTLANEKSVKLKVYQCKYCQLWHLSSQ